MSDRHQRLTELFTTAVELDPPGRAQLLGELVREDPELASELAALLDAEARADSALDTGGLARGMGSQSTARVRPRAREDLPAGHVIAGRYRVIGHLGSGGMGEVHEVEHVLLGKRFALKRLLRDGATDRAAVERFLREARAAAATGHPGVVDVFDVGFDEDGVPYLVMERLVGETLRARLDRGPLELAELLRAGHAILDALAAVHAASIIHRDMKPENIFLCGDGRLKILDFGLSRGTSKDDRLTWSGAVLGTPLYMSPEQARGEPLDARADLYAVGAVLYECAAGRPPFEGPFSVLIAMALESPADPAPIAHLPARTRDPILAALAKTRDDRPASAAAMRDALGAPPEPAAPAAGGTGPRARSRRRWWWVAIPAASVAGAVIATRGDSAPQAAAIEVDSTRRLTFDTGCEAYPRFTPDGTRVIYDGVVGGDVELLAISITGDDRRRLTHAPGRDHAAAVSPDGTRIAYVHEDANGRTLRLIGIAGDRAGPTHDLGPITGAPAWTRDGALLAGDAAGWIVRRELAPAPSGEVVHETVLDRPPAAARPYLLAAVAEAGVAMLWWSSSEVDAVLGELDRADPPRSIADAITAYEGGIAPSPTRAGYYVTRRAAPADREVVWRAWGGGPAQVVPGGLSPGAGLDVARDGHRLALSTCVAHAYVARVRTGQAPEVVSRGDWQDRDAFAIEGGRLLVTSDRLRLRQGWLLDLATGDARPVTPPDSRTSAPSRDGTQAVYVADGGRGGLAVIDIAGGTPRRLTEDRTDATPVFTGDGKYVVFVRALGARSVIHVVAAGGGLVKPVAEGFAPAASPIDDTIAFVADLGVTGKRRVLLTDLAGTTPLPVPGLAPAAWDHPRFSPDGKRLLLIRGGREIVAVPLDRSGGPAVLWRARTERVLAADWAPDGDGIIATLAEYDGDLWLAEGSFP